MDIDWTVIAVGVAIAGLVLNSQWQANRKSEAMREEIKDQGKEIARITGFLEAWLAGAARSDTPK